MQSLTVISEAQIRKVIEENNYIPEKARNHITTKEFSELYGLEALKKMSDGQKVLHFLFGLKQHNENSLTYCLEYKPNFIHFYGEATATATTKTLNCSNGSWKNYKRD